RCPCENGFDGREGRKGMKSFGRIGVLLLGSAPVLLGQQPVRVKPTFEDPNRSISVTGEALQYVVPDEAVVRLGVETFDPALDGAIAGSDARGNRLVRAVRQAGVGEKGSQARAG